MVSHLNVPPPSVDESLGKEHLISRDEVMEIARKLRAKKTAPGPNDVSIRALALASGSLAEGLRNLFNRCLRAGRFPAAWKKVRMVFLL